MSSTSDTVRLTMIARIRRFEQRGFKTSIPITTETPLVDVMEELDRLERDAYIRESEQDEGRQRRLRRTCIDALAAGIRGNSPAVDASLSVPPGTSSEFADALSNRADLLEQIEEPLQLALAIGLEGMAALIATSRSSNYDWLFNSSPARSATPEGSAGDGHVDSDGEASPLG